jgi:hypothetical protein
MARWPPGIAALALVGAAAAAVAVVLLAHPMRPESSLQQLRLVSPPSVQGVVVTESGTPIPDAFVEDWNGNRTWTDDDGRFELLAEPGLVEVTAVAGPESVALAGQSTVELTRDESVDVRIVVRPVTHPWSRAVFVRLHGEADVPLVDWSVLDPGHGGILERTDARGKVRWLVEDTPGRRARLRIAPPGVDPRGAGAVEIEVVPRHPRAAEPEQVFVRVP